MANEKRLIDANDMWQKTFVCDEVAEVRKFIEQAPTVDAVEVVHAHWDNNGICTMCGYPIPTDSKCDFIDEDDCLFCYHCGAKMKGENEDG